MKKYPAANNSIAGDFLRPHPLASSMYENSFDPTE
jgi:hypothetical protein